MVNAFVVLVLKSENRYNLEKPQLWWCKMYF